MNNKWMRNGSNFRLNEISNQEDKLEKGVYKLQADQRGFYLEHLSEVFDFSYKVYGLESKFVDRVVKTYSEISTNLGVLLTGIKGTGKTVTAQQICNKLGLPVIIVSAAYRGVADFVNEIQQNVVIFFDEFEKVFDTEEGGDEQLLTLLDGVLKTNYRKLFLLTTNSLHVNGNFLQRPGRILYVKKFDGLDIDNVINIIDDKLINTQFREDVIKFISQLQLVTVDVVSSIVREVNIHNESPFEFEDVFNIEKIVSEFDIYKIYNNNEGRLIEEPVAYKAKITPDIIEGCEDYTFYIGRKSYGVIREYLGDSSIKVEDNNGSMVIYKIVPIKTYNKIFNGYGF